MRDSDANIGTSAQEGKAANPFDSPNQEDMLTEKRAQKHAQTVIAVQVNESGTGKAAEYGINAINDLQIHQATPSVNATGFSSISRAKIARRASIIKPPNPGFNKSSKHKIVRQFIQEYNLSLLGLLETKIPGNKLQSLAMKITKDWKWISNVHEAGNGRIWLLWDSDILTVQEIILTDQYITCRIESRDVMLLVPGLLEGISMQSLVDHSPALLTIEDDIITGKRPFKFFNMWVKHPDFMSTVKAIWEQNIDGFKMYSFHSKLKMLKTALKDLNKKHYMNISEQVLRAKNSLTEVQGLLSGDLFNPDLIRREKDCIKKYERLLDCESSFYKQKANINWCLDGDKVHPDPMVIANGPLLSPDQSHELSSPVTRDEIKQTVFSMANDKSPGPDGFSAIFFKASWSIISEELFSAAEEFFKSGKLLGTFNSTSITLIPKIHNPQYAADFRPISCCNCVYKIITKIIASRIQKVVGYLISDAQSAFVKGRLISSNILLAHEIVKHYGRKNNSPRAILNIDLRKAFDTISWVFINDMLKGLRFPDNMISWIMECISTPRFSISINGTPHGYFQGARGLRQGDPLSPYLFVIGMEYLSMKLNTLKGDKLYRFHPKCSRLKITHLAFADDLLLFGRADMYTISRLRDCLAEFKISYGGIKFIW
ncbi:uncharacterized protein LOC109823260 [Asparagus officinalis]|uniref:uncharacterized protein LOC109823260 n=1 Tax=Asparagus officinalis TaxID=4686 RepID=UPI00098DFD31|nr:uncharacterized protein LOC109823260 [Asparagus officinalis]